MIIPIIPVMSRSFSSNSYILVDSKNACIIDSGISPHTFEIIKKIEELKITLLFIINTHCHYDHVAGNLQLKKMYPKVKILIHEFDADFLESGDDKFMHAKIFNSIPIKIEVDWKLKDDDIIELGKKIKLEVIHTPGHSLGSICLYEEKTKSLFSGDTVFREGVGRTDLPGGNFNLLKKSMEKLIKLNETRGIEKIYPGHGEIGSGDDIEKNYKWYFLTHKPFFLSKRKALAEKEKKGILSI